MKRSAFVVVGLLIGMVLMAAPVSKDEARQKAQQFLSRHSGNEAAARGMQQVKLQLKEGVAADQLFVFNVGQREGFVIVSGDDCTGDAILGYADSGEITAENMPTNLKAWLQGYADEIQWMKEHGVTNDVSAARALTATSTRTPVAEQMTCRWNQDAPYNKYCVFNSSQCVTGCVATAVAQVLSFHGKRIGTKTTTLKAIPAYTTEKNSYSVTEKPIREFDWSKMYDTYSSGDDAEKVEEMARLMEYVGAGVKMDYGTGSSGASSTSVPGMLKDYFGYDKNMQLVYRNDYLYSDWLDLIYEELTTNGPVLYSGQSTNGGHEFVIDGYDEEDYFYVNWGWGGDSNGFFKLSVLYSSEQGIGGSTAQSGYCFTQDAVIGVNPVAGGTDNSIRFTMSAVAVNSASYNRASASEDFTNVLLRMTMFNLTGETHDIDYRWALHDGESYTLLGETSTAEGLANNNGINGGLYVSFGAGLDDGDYRLVPVSKEHSAETWMPNFRSARYYIAATIAGNTLTLTPMGGASALTATLASSGNKVGSTVTVTATVANSGSVYSGDLKLMRSMGNDVYSYLAAQQVEIAAGATDDEVTFAFTPSSTGTFNLSLMDKDDRIIGTGSVVIVESDATKGTLSIADPDGITFDNAVGASYTGGFYGSTLRGHVTVKNTSEENDHNEGIKIAIWRYNGYNYSFLKRQSYDCDIPKNNGSQIIDFEFDDLTVGTDYLLTFEYVSKSVIEQSYSFSSFNGVTTIAADGTETTVAPSASIVVTDAVLSLDITATGVDGVVTSVTPNSNPNTLYFVGNTLPSGLDGKNVVQNGTAATLTLSAGDDFYASEAFNVTAAPSFTRQFTVAADGSNGWTTIVLPFDVKMVKQGDRVIDWFHSGSDTGKHFWVKTFSSENGSTVNFDFVDEMKANTPYIIAVPGNRWGEAWNLTNKDITFYGEAASAIPASRKASVNGNNYKFTGSTCHEDVTDMYVMNASGNSFDKTNATVPAFQSYFKPLKMTLGVAECLSIGHEGHSTGISLPEVPSLTDQEGIYTLSGQRITKPGKGIYIIGSKKVVVK